jgi:iron complex outermembrane receptor protein
MFDNRFTLRHGLLTGVAAVALVLAAPAAAQDVARDYDLPAQGLGRSLAEVSKAAGREVMVSSKLVRGKTAPALKGRYTADQAYGALLAGQGLKVTPVGAVLVLQAASPGAGLGETPPAAAEALSEIVVTGTRIRGAAPVGAHLLSIARQDMETSGYATAVQVILASPQNFGGGPSEATQGLSIRNGAGTNVANGSGINLRGLGPRSTLVLFNGVRPALGGVSGTFADLSLVPSLAVERVEILADGASALYGSDAVAGVVNLVPRREFDGAETTARLGAANGFEERLFGQIYGRRWSGGHAVVAYEYYHRDRLAAADRDYATEDLRPLGGLDYRTSYAAPGTIVASGRSFGIPAGQDGRSLTAAQLRSGQPNLGDAWASSDLLPTQSRHAAYVGVSQSVGANLTLSGDVNWAQRRFERRGVAEVRNNTVTAANPFYLDPIGGGQPVQVRYDFTGDLGALTNSGMVRAVNGVIGADYRLQSWSASASAGYGRQREATRTDNQINTYRLGSALSDSNPATAYNLFGDPGSTPWSTIDKVRGFASSRGRYQVWFVSAKADGPLFTLPAGVVRLAVGGEQREEQFDKVSIADTASAAPRNIANVYPPSRKVSAAYAELRIPVLGEGRTPLRRLDLSLAGRVERYDQWGVTRNPKIGLDWRPIDGLVLRGAYGTSFHAPSFENQIVGTGYVAYQPITIPDPQSPTGTSTVLGLLGNTAEIGPERAKTWTIGAEARPSWLPGAHASVTYYKIRYRDRIANPNSAAFDVLPNRNVYASLINEHPTLAEVQAYYASPFLTNYDNIPASAVQIILDLRVQNLSIVDQDGIDLALDYGRDLGPGHLTAGLSGSYTMHLKQGFTPTAPQIDVLGTVGSPVPLRARAQLGWSQGPVAIHGFVNFIDGYRNQTISPAQHVDAWTTADLQISYTFQAKTGPLSGLKAALSASNLFDKDPPFAVLRTPSTVTGFNPDNASPDGRLIALQVTKAW